MFKVTKVFCEEGSFALTEEDTEGVLTKAGNVWKVKNANSERSCCPYNERSVNKAFQSEGLVRLCYPTMLNDFVTVHTKLANSQKLCGGTSSWMPLPAR